MNQIKVELQGFFGSDRDIASAAWTSSTLYQGKNMKTDDQVANLVQRLAEDGHAVPFESVILRFWMRLPIAIDRQLMTHRMASHSGMSGRYRTMPSEYLDVPEDIESILLKMNNLYWPNDTKTSMNPMEEYIHICEEANNFYGSLLTVLKEKEKSREITNQEYKRMREFFRGCLPQHNMTERVSIFNLRSFANLMKLRNKPNAQPEIQYLAKMMLDEVLKANVAPVAVNTLMKNDWEL